MALFCKAERGNVAMWLYHRRSRRSANQGRISEITVTKVQRKWNRESILNDFVMVELDSSYGLSSCWANDSEQTVPARLLSLGEVVWNGELFDLRARLSVLRRWRWRWKELYAQLIESKARVCRFLTWRRIRFWRWWLATASGSAFNFNSPVHPP